MEKRILVAEDRCTGCRICELICSFNKTKTELNPRKGGIRVTSVEKEGLRSLVTVCRQCQEPACLKACPTGALHKSADGVVMFTEQRCNSCGFCVEACSFEAITLSGSTPKIIKCDLCGQGEPLCVEYCPRDCIRIYQRAPES